MSHCPAMHSAEEEHGYPGAVTLNVTALQKFYAKKFGDNLTLDLFSSDPVTVTFTGSTETLVCSVIGNNTVCSPEYANRVSVINNSLTLSGLTSSDSGMFTVKEKTGEVISVNTVTVEGVTQGHHYIALSLLTAFALSCICLFFWCKCHRKSQAPEAQYYYSAAESTADIEPSREPACIGLSQQETSTNVSEDSHIYTHAPIEDTMTMMSTKKQDSTEDVVCGVRVWNTSGI
ncbi:uncharacterized protein si:dkey-22i16.9 [Chanodichthys erythropterus]|uniref:uncharacterized protein si:dkey-22i16.9 n=1 Tax=Chanodichthys erythropterus TaxID=933992 RepID=UPI00351E5739